jgi:hypothetical protein
VGLGIVCAAVMLRPGAAAAQQDVNDLKAELQAQKQRQAELEEKIDRLEARQKLQEQAAQKGAQAPASKPEGEKKPEAIPESLKWISKLNLYGDLRYRYEYIDDDSAAEDRHRNRIRARLGLDVKVSDEWNLGFRLATGTTESNGISGDPVSTNQTLDEAFSKKPLWLDLAFFGYHPSWLKGLDVFGGKINMPFYRAGKNELIWDSDLTPEGGAILYTTPLTEKTAASVATGGFWVNEESSGHDVSLWGIQAFVKHQLNEPTYVVGGASWYDYANIQGSESLAREWKGTNDFFGNTATPGNKFAGDYDLFELFAEFGTDVAKVPVAVFGDWVQNTVAVDDGEDTGWLIGGQISRLKDRGSWQFEYDYRDLQLDAVVGQFSGSDFVGGGTGGKGHRFAFSYMVAKNVAAALTYYADEYSGRNGDAEYDRIEADLGIKF